MKFSYLLPSICFFLALFASPAHAQSPDDVYSGQPAKPSTQKTATNEAEPTDLLHPRGAFLVDVMALYRGEIVLGAGFNVTPALSLEGHVGYQVSNYRPNLLKEFLANEPNPYPIITDGGLVAAFALRWTAKPIGSSAYVHLGGTNRRLKLTAWEANMVFTEVSLGVGYRKYLGSRFFVEGDFFFGGVMGNDLYRRQFNRQWPQDTRNNLEEGDVQFNVGVQVRVGHTF